jgi:acyl-CoA dehydrogenase
VSDLEADLRSLVRSIVAGLPEEADHRATWEALSSAGITSVGTARPEDASSGDLWDAAACVEELAATGRSAPLVENAVGRWALGPDAPADETLVTVGVGEPLQSPIRIPWATDAAAVVILGADGVYSVNPDRMAVIDELDIAGDPVGQVAIDSAPDRLDVDPAEVAIRLRVLRAAALVGVCRAMHVMTRAHVRTREQFGKPLIAIPAVATAVAVMRTRLVQAETALRRARTAPDPSSAAIVARLVAAEQAGEVAATAHQLHGALGVTRDYGLQRLSRRAWAWRDLDWREHALATELGKLALAVTEARYWDEVTA